MINKICKNKSPLHLYDLIRDSNRTHIDKNSSNIIGKLRANFVGTEFQIYDNGTNPKHTDPFFDEPGLDNLHDLLESANDT